MSDLTCTANNVAVVFPPTGSDPGRAEIYSYCAGANLTPGTPVYVDASGKVQPADANGSSPANRFRGIALENVKSGQVVSVIVKGAISGYDLSGMAYDAAVYVSDTAGALADSAGSTTLVAGRVMALPDKARTKILYLTGFSG